MSAAVLPGTTHVILPVPLGVGSIIQRLQSSGDALSCANVQFPSLPTRAKPERDRDREEFN